MELPNERPKYHLTKAVKHPRMSRFHLQVIVRNRNWLHLQCWKLLKPQTKWTARMALDMGRSHLPHQQVHGIKCLEWCIHESPTLIHRLYLLYCRPALSDLRMCRSKGKLKVNQHQNSVEHDICRILVKNMLSLSIYIYMLIKYNIYIYICYIYICCIYIYMHIILAPTDPFILSIYVRPPMCPWSHPILVGWATDGIHEKPRYETHPYDSYDVMNFIPFGSVMFSYNFLWRYHIHSSGGKSMARLKMYMYLHIHVRVCGILNPVVSSPSTVDQTPQ